MKYNYVQPKNDPTNWKKGTSLFEQFGYKFERPNIAGEVGRSLFGTPDTDKHTEFDSVDTSNGEYSPSEDDYRTFDPQDPQHGLINVWDQDAIFTYGVQMRYYKLKPPEEQEYYNKFYRENRSREYEGAVLERDELFASMREVRPFVVYGLYAPGEMDQDLSGYGSDTRRSASFWFNRVYITSLLGRDPRMGDIIIPYDIPEQLWEVMEIQPDNRTLHVPRRWKLTCELFQMSQ